MFKAISRLVWLYYLYYFPVNVVFKWGGDRSKISGDCHHVIFCRYLHDADGFWNFNIGFIVLHALTFYLNEINDLGSFQSNTWIKGSEEFTFVIRLKCGFPYIDSLSPRFWELNNSRYKGILAWQKMTQLAPHILRTWSCVRRSHPPVFRIHTSTHSFWNP